jgi:hypothetical protein
VSDIEILSRDVIVAQATDAAEKAVADDRGAENPHIAGSEAAQLWWKTYCSQLLHFGAERMRAKRGETA